jgi:adenosylcobinamide kinase/adenosylcobinamide-phosphate guanylyltransferase
VTVLIIGHPDSGKSELAERMVTEISAPGERIYLATMIPYGAEGAARVDKHRKMREGKGFTTIEAPFDITEAIGKIDKPADSTVLLECLSNLVANELFERHTLPSEITAKLSDDVKQLAGKVNNLIIVSNHFEITADFDEETKTYAQTMDTLNDELVGICDKVIRID